MEQLLFYRYLSFQRKQFSKLGKKLKNIPLWMTALFLLVLISLVVGVGSLLLGCNRWVGIGAAVCELILAIASYWAIENYSIQNSQKQMERYWEYCTELKKDLTATNIHTREEIEEMKKRILNRVQNMKAERQVTNASLVKLGEIVAIPVVLAIITTGVNQMNDVGEMVALVTNILLVSGLSVATGFSLLNLFRFPQKRKIEQMNEFCEDLQGVLDLERFGTDVNNQNSDEK